MGKALTSFHSFFFNKKRLKVFPNKGQLRMGLAERRTKQRLAPSYAPLAKETGSFAMKMMQKMGWKEGQGLGSKNDEKQKPLDTSNKSTETDSHFDELLKKLNDKKGEHKEVKKKVPVKAVLPTHKKRLHRSKCVSQYSEAQMQEIMGGVPRVEPNSK